MINNAYEPDLNPHVPSQRLKAINRNNVIRADSCISCGLCATLCPQGVHRRIEGHVHLLPPYEGKCIGPSCSKNDY